MTQDKIDAREAIAGFAALGVILAIEILMILKVSVHHEVPLPALARLVAHALFKQ